MFKNIKNSITEVPVLGLLWFSEQFLLEIYAVEPMECMGMDI